MTWIKTVVRTLIFDQPLPREEMTARERNKLIYDMAFKSLCLDWTKRHGITEHRPSVMDNSETSNIASSNNLGEDWDFEQNENLQYNLWTFGDMDILIRHQADGEIIDKVNKDFFFFFCF
jgi:hypothetical protein